MSGGTFQPADLPSLAPFDPTTMIQSLDERGVGLRVVFYRRADRYGHVVARVQQGPDGGEQILPLLSSLEGEPQDNWPPGPVLQSLSIEQRPSGAVALLVGMAGRSHWSAGVEAKGGKGEIEFDIACRAAPKPEWLGSRYVVLDAAVAAQIVPFSGTELVQILGRLELSPIALIAVPVRWQYAIGRP